MFDQKASAVTNRKIAAKEATSSRRLINMAVVPSNRLQHRDRMVATMELHPACQFFLVRNQGIGEIERVDLP
jgi:hypothetical protein